MIGQLEWNSDIEVSMVSRRDFSSAATRYAIVSIAIVGLGASWGCGGGVSSHVTLDEEQKKRLEDAQENMRKSMAKRQSSDRSGKAKAKKP